MKRRDFILSAVVLTIGQHAKLFANEQSPRILFVHGRAQGDKNAKIIQQQWTDALKTGLDKNGLTLSKDLMIDVPFYGELLDDLTEQFATPLPQNIAAKGEDSIDLELSLIHI